MTKSRDDAIAILHQYTKSESLRKHALAVEQAMKACARKYAPEEDPVRWGICGLLHDFDYEQYPNADQHPYVGSKILEEAGFDPELRRAIMGHAPYTGVQRDTMMAKALFACLNAIAQSEEGAAISQTTHRFWKEAAEKG